MCLLFYFDKLLSINPWSNIQYFPVWFWLVQVRENGIIDGFYLPSFGEGLIIANTSTAGLGLMKLRLKTKSKAVFPSDNLEASGFMLKNNLMPFAKAKRMRLGKKRDVILKDIYNRAGGNIG
jgi:hypothetical protein